MKRRLYEAHASLEENANAIGGPLAIREAGRRETRVCERAVVETEDQAEQYRTAPQIRARTPRMPRRPGGGGAGRWNDAWLMARGAGSKKRGSEEQRARSR